MKTVVFMGSPDFAVKALQALIDSPGYDVKLVVSQTDKPQGRHKTLTAPPVKQLALQYELPVFQPVSLKNSEAYERIASEKPDFIVVSAYGKILPQNVLDIPVYGCVNLHGSLLPRYRGAAPIQWSVINGEKETGVTTMLMDAGLDTGDILFAEKLTVGENETAGELFDRLADICPALLIKTLDALSEGAVVPKKQNESEATYVSVLDKEMAVIDWNADMISIHNKVRGLNPWPVAKTLFRGKNLKIFSGEKTKLSSEGVPGSIIVRNGEMFAVCGDGLLYKIKELQAEGSKRMPSDDFLRGQRLAENERLGQRELNTNRL